ncbi:MAG: cytochrome c biogenesis protein CcdA [Anaerolineales bacterium]|nr:cytochrome c biogenesis protein CcdA [Anaerolineales bacterium]
MNSSSPMPAPKASRLATLGHALFFVGGFSLVFVLGWGGGATLIGQIFSQYKSLIGRVGGFVVILFGFVTLGVLRVPWLLADTRPQMRRLGASRLVNSGLFGVLFAAGWTPCVGATLGAILTLGFSQETAGQAMVLSSGYALGLGLPFLGLAILLERALIIVRRMHKYVRVFQWISGLFLIVIGILMVTDRITLIAIWAQSNGLFLDLPLGGASVPTYLAAVAAGAISFFSPCVLPLVPAYLGYLSGQGALTSTRAA